MQWTAVGHQRQKRWLERHLGGDSLPHANLFSGPDGIGKRMIALDAIRYLLASAGEPGSNPDCRILAPTVDTETGKLSDIAVEDVRVLKSWLFQRPLFAPVKTVLIEDADCLSAPAANTLLKVLEEPPAYACFFLVTSHPGAVLQTVRSRCHEMTFLPLADTEMREALTDVRLDADEKKLLQIVAAGRPGVALALLRTAGVPKIARAIALLERLPGMDVARRLIAMKDLSEDAGLSDVVAWWLSWTHARLGDTPHLAAVAHGLLDLSVAVNESKYNRRLALERFVLQLPA